MPTYESINSERHEVRLLRLEPEGERRIISGTLIKASLLDQPHYQALSYCWGDPDDRVAAILDTRRALITRNLNHALQYLRRHGYSTVWVDAVCINQSDETEKSLQIRNMKQVYHQGANTISWLGKRGNDRAELAIKFLHLINSDNIHWTPPPIYNSTRRRPPPENRVRHESGCLDHLQSTDGPGYDDMMLGILRSRPESEESSPGPRCYDCALTICFQALVDLLERPYWRRRWIIQEIAASPRVTLVCGSATISIQLLEEGINRCRKSPCWQPRHTAAAEHYLTMLDLRQHIMSQSITLVDAIVRTTKFLSKDPRDKIYSLIGISSEGSELVPMPTYYRPPATATTHFTRALIQKYQCLDLIWIGERARGPDSTLPTWVPDWLSDGVPQDWAGVVKSPSLVVSKSFALQCLGHEGTSVINLEGIILATIRSTTSRTGSITGAREASSRAAGEGSGGGGTRGYYGSTRRILRALLWCTFLEQTVSQEALFPKCLVANNIFRYSYDTKSRLGSTLERMGRCSPFPSLTDRVVLSYAQRSLRRGTSRYLPSYNEAFDSWLRVNRNFSVDGRPLESWLMHASTAHRCLSYRRARLCGSVVLALVALVMGATLVALSSGHAGNFGILTIISGVVLIFVGLWLEVSVMGTYSIMQRRLLFGSTASTPRKAIVADTGMLAQVSPLAQPGDQICFIAGCSMAVVMRQVPGNRTTDSARYKIIGTACCFLSADDSEKLDLWLFERWSSKRRREISDRQPRPRRDISDRQPRPRRERPGGNSRPRNLQQQGQPVELRRRQEQAERFEQNLTRCRTETRWTKFQVI